MIKSRLEAVVQMDHAVAESAFVEQLKLQPDIVRQRWIASSHNDGGEEQMTLVDQPEPQCPGSERGTGHGDVACRSGFELLNRFRVKRSIDVRALDTCSRLLE